MAGVKGRSGRKTRYQEVQEGKLQKICHDWLLKNFPTFTDAMKLKVALPLVDKLYASKQDISVDNTISVDSDQINDALREARIKDVQNDN